jgi:hypothetical protein
LIEARAGRNCDCDKAPGDWYWKTRIGTYNLRWAGSEKRKDKAFQKKTKKNKGFPLLPATSGFFSNNSFFFATFFVTAMTTAAIVTAI